MHTLLERVTVSIAFDAHKHDLWQKNYFSIEAYVQAKVNEMTPYQLLEAISLALEPV